MRHLTGETAESYVTGGVDVTRWEQFGLADTLPFQAMWYSVPPRSSSPTDRHPELELSVVVDGTAAVEAGGRVTEVAQGSCFLLDSDEPHVIHNRSDTPLRVFTTFWMPRRTAGAAGTAEAAATGPGDAP